MNILKVIKKYFTPLVFFSPRIRYKWWVITFYKIDKSFLRKNYLEKSLNVVYKNNFKLQQV